MDDSDRATMLEEIARAAALAVRKPQSEIYLTGACWNCEMVTGALFCSGDCRDDWAKRDDADKMAGR